MPAHYWKYTLITDDSWMYKLHTVLVNLDLGHERSRIDWYRPIFLGIVGAS